MKTFTILFLAGILCGCTTHVDSQPKPKAGIDFGPELIRDIVISGCTPHQWTVAFTPETAALWNDKQYLYSATTTTDSFIGGYGSTPDAAIAKGAQRLCEYEKNLAKFSQSK